MRTTFILPAIALLVTACASTPRVDRMSEEQQLRELDRQALAAAKAGNAAALANLYATDAVAMPSNAPVARGSDAIRQSWAQAFATPGYQLDFTPTRVEVSQSGDMAYITGTWRSSANLPNGRLDDRGTYMTVWKKVDGQWKATASIGTSERPIEQLAAAVMPKPQVAAGAVATDTTAMMTHGAHHHVKDIAWRDGPPSLPKGAQIAVLEGDPSKAGAFTFRLKFPSGYRIPPHFHPVIEHVTVMSGALSIGQGDTWDDSKLVRLNTGDFIYMPPGSRHFAQAHGETVIQLHSTGPWGITYVNPQDDPRK